MYNKSANQFQNLTSDYLSNNMNQAKDLAFGSFIKVKDTGLD